MEAKELMIGDWVKKPRHDLYLPVDIDALKWINDYLLEPIPLTPKILEANDAEVCYESCYQKKYHIWMDDETCIEYKFSKQTEEYNNLKIYKDGGECVNIHVLYVHELQHALRLCGLTELADNFKIE